MLNYQVVPEKEVPLNLLLIADASESSVKKYLVGSKCFCAIDDKNIIGVCVVNKNVNSVLEIFNIGILPEKQKQGIGTKLLDFVIRELVDSGEKRIELGTGTFGYQLLFYQRFGFRVESIWKNHFIDNYEEPIFVKGVQLKDMLRLYLAL